MKYKDKLLHPKWQKKRLEILNRDGFACRYCSDMDTTLHVHHKSYGGREPWEVNNSELESVCKHCHSILELVKRLKCKVINIKKDIIDNGFQLCAVIQQKEEIPSLAIFWYKDEFLNHRASIGNLTCSFYDFELQKWNEL